MIFNDPPSENPILKPPAIPFPSSIRTIYPIFKPKANICAHQNARIPMIRGKQELKRADRKITSSIFRESGTSFRDLKNGRAGSVHFRLCLPKYARFENPISAGGYSPHLIQKKDSPSVKQGFPGSAPAIWQPVRSRLNRTRDRLPVLISPAQIFFYYFLDLLLVQEPAPDLLPVRYLIPALNFFPVVRWVSDLLSVTNIVQDFLPVQDLFCCGLPVLSGFFWQWAGPVPVCRLFPHPPSFFCQQKRMM
jgi:hypothetical protein